MPGPSSVAPSRALDERSDVAPATAYQTALPCTSPKRLRRAPQGRGPRRAPPRFPRARSRPRFPARTRAIVGNRNVRGPTPCQSRSRPCRCRRRPAPPPWRAARPRGVGTGRRAPPRTRRGPCSRSRCPGRAARRVPPRCRGPTSASGRAATRPTRRGTTRTAAPIPPTAGEREDDDTDDAAGNRPRSRHRAGKPPGRRDGHVDGQREREGPRQPLGGRTARRGVDERQAAEHDGRGDRAPRCCRRDGRACSRRGRRQSPR